jgi:phage tail sheath gpL-like
MSSFSLIIQDDKYTVTCASVDAADTVTVNGVVLTAVSDATPGANEFDMSGTDAACATSLAAAINGSASAMLSTVVSASADDDVVTISCKHKGYLGNAVTLASSDAGRLAVSAARLAGGTGGFGSSATTYEYGA